MLECGWKGTLLPSYLPIVSFCLSLGTLTMPSVKRVHVEEQEAADRNIIGGDPSAWSRLLKPLSYSGTLDNYTHQDITPVIGREYEGLQVTELLKCGDDMIRDLAVTSMSIPKL